MDRSRDAACRYKAVPAAPHLRAADLHIGQVKEPWQRKRIFSRNKIQAAHQAFERILHVYKTENTSIRRTCGEERWIFINLHKLSGYFRTELWCFLAPIQWKCIPFHWKMVSYVHLLPATSISVRYWTQSAAPVAGQLTAGFLCVSCTLGCFSFNDWRDSTCVYLAPGATQGQSRWVRQTNWFFLLGATFFQCGCQIFPKKCFKKNI